MLNVIFRPTASLVRAHFIHWPRWLQTQSWAVAGFCLIIPSAATAQPAELDPLNAQTTAPLITYQSAFSDYKPYQDPELMPWKTANDVVRQFGGMAGMGNMSEGENPDNMDAKPVGNQQATPPAQPAHDMSNMKPDKPAPASKESATPASKPAEMQTMPGHDMSKMQKAPTAPATNPSPPLGKPAAPAPMPGHGGMSH